jgi:hypothetical protein
MPIRSEADFFHGLANKLGGHENDKDNKARAPV